MPRNGQDSEDWTRPLADPLLEAFARALAEGRPLFQAYEVAVGSSRPGSSRKDREREAVRWFKSEAVTFRVAWLRFKREAALEEAVASLDERVRKW